MKKICPQCSAAFEITKEDLAFLDKLSPVFSGKKEGIPPPTLCSDCRQQRRVSHINELNLYRNVCSVTGKPLISCFHPDGGYSVMEQSLWHGDGWDALSYGRAFDFKRPFFEQFHELSLAVPRPNVITGYQYDENCEYTNYAGKNKDSYLIFDSDENRDAYYSYSVNGCRDVCDSYRARRCELCYEAVDSVGCYRCLYAQDCDNCSDSAFLLNCTGCKNCLMCANLKNKEYHVENKPVTKEQFEAFRAKLGQRSILKQAKARFEALKLQVPHKCTHGRQNENVRGDYIIESKNAVDCFDGEQLWDCKRLYQSFMPAKDSMDCSEIGDAELCYECSCAGYATHRLLFCTTCLDQLSDMTYCSFCWHGQSLFGCCGIRRGKYCILNKQYSKEDYEKLVPKIIAHMRETGEWGECFPTALSPFTYNETIAQIHYPLTAQQAKELGVAWRTDVASETEYMGPDYAIPDAIADVGDDICNRILRCEKTGKLFKIIPQELALYRTLNVPVPTLCFEARHQARLALRNPRQLWNRQCMKCKQSMVTSFAPERPEIVYCEDCYLSTVY